MRRFLLTLMALALVAAACGSDDASSSSEGDTSTDTAAETESEAEEPEPADADGEDTVEEEAMEETEAVTITLVTHDSFAVSEGILQTFTDETGISVELLSAGDAGEVVSRAVLSAGQPEGDVMFGIDNTFLQRGLDADLFVPHQSAALSDVPDELELDPEYRVTPIDVSDVCVNYWTDALPGDAPTSLDDLIDPANAASFVTENPESSSPGFAFLLATIVRYGEDGWEDYWQQLVDGGMSVTSGWSEAYYGEFIAGGGERALVTSYASSPPAEKIFADPPVDAPPTGVLEDSCFRQIEFAGILAGTEHPAEAGQLIDFMLSETFQADIPLNMFVYPANETVALPPEFVEFGPLTANPITMDPADIEAGRLDWTERWTNIVLR